MTVNKKYYVHLTFSISLLPVTLTNGSTSYTESVGATNAIQSLSL